MKKKNIFALALAGIFLTSCSSGGEEVAEASAESSITTVSETSAETAVTTTVTTTAATAETSAETTIAETLPPVVENMVEGVSLEYEIVPLEGVLADNEYFWGGMFISGDIAAMGCYNRNGGTVRFLDIDDMSVKADIAAPEGWEWGIRDYCPCIEDGVLCRIPLSRFNSETLLYEYAALIVHDDFTTEIAEGEPDVIFSFPAGEHNISDYTNDIVDADSGEVIVEGVVDDSPSGFGNMSVWYDYNFSVDGDRFVYRACGIEWMPAFGYYDFSAGKAVEFDNSRNLIPVGYHGGKIFAMEREWDGECQGELYTFDIETGEKAHFMSSPAEFEDSIGFVEYAEYSMPENGEYIAAMHRKYDHTNLETALTEFYIISPESGETLAKCGLNTAGISYSISFADNNRFIAYDGDNNEFIVFTVNL